MTRLITLLALVLLLASCRWKMDEKKEVAAPASPVLASLKDSGLPCFTCHAYARFARDERGSFSHPKHATFGVHCNQCHIIAAHKQSTIRRDACDKCHNLSNFSYDAAGMPVTFSHQKHAKRDRCGSCHPNLFNMKLGTTHITMDGMYKGENCGSCHNGKPAFSANECAKCHTMAAFKKELRYPSGGVSDAIFSHQVHTVMFDCSTCHPSIFKFRKGGSGMKMDTIYKGQYCGSCHNGQMAFGSMECKRCHK